MKQKDIWLFRFEPCLDLFGTSANGVNVPACYFDDFLRDFFIATVGLLEPFTDLTNFFEFFCAATPNFLALEYHANEVPFWDDLRVGSIVSSSEAADLTCWIDRISHTGLDAREGAGN